MSALARLTATLVLTSVLVLVPRAAQAQDGTEQPDLPDIAPREVEIRGQLEISFPSLQRQPLIGFNPPPRLPEIPANRRPFVEAYKQESVDLPPSPLSPPAPPGLPGLATYPPARLELDATGGRYFSRTVRGRANVPWGQGEVLTVRLDHSGLDSYTPFEEEAPYNLFDGSIGISTHRSTISAGAEVGGFADTYNLFGALTGAAAGGVVPHPTRDGRGLNAGAWLRAGSAAGTDGRLAVAFESAAFETDVFEDDSIDEEFRRTSRHFSADGGVEFPAGVARLGVEGQFGRSLLDETTAANSGATAYDAAAYLRLPIADRMQLTAGARFIGFSLETEEGLDVDAGVPEDEQVIAPDVRVEMYLAHGAMLYVHNRPELTENDLGSMFEANPFLVAEPVVAPTIRSLELEGGGRFFAGPVQIGLRGGYRDYPNLLFFEHADASETGSYERGFSAARYGEATVVYGGGDLSVSIARGVLATIGVTGRRGRLENDEPIPYFGTVLGNAMFSFAFDRSRGLVQLNGTYESSRVRDRAESRDLGDYFDLDVLATYNVTPAFKVLLAIDNISADRLERYDGYPQPSFVARAGVGVRW